MEGSSAKVVSITANDPLHPISGLALSPSQCWVPTTLFIVGAALVATFLLKASETKAAIREEPDEGPLVPADARQHQRVLAKARQASHINSAAAYNKSGEFTKAMLELAKALAENSVCRAPATLPHNKEVMADLYRLHIRYTEQPPSFATLLQLQEMLGLTQEEAERIELELMHCPGAFAI